MTAHYAFEPMHVQLSSVVQSTYRHNSEDSGPSAWERSLIDNSTHASIQYRNMKSKIPFTVYALTISVRPTLFCLMLYVQSQSVTYVGHCSLLYITATFYILHDILPPALVSSISTIHAMQPSTTRTNLATTTYY